MPVQVSPEFSEKLFAAIHADPETEVEVNLPAQTITLLATGKKETFEISPYKKDNMINGFDDIDYLQSIKTEIEEFALHLPLYNASPCPSAKEMARTRCSSRKQFQSRSPLERIVGLRLD